MINAKCEADITVKISLSKQFDFSDSQKNHIYSCLQDKLQEFVEDEIFRLFKSPVEILGVNITDFETQYEQEDIE